MADTKTILPLGSAAQADNDPHRLDYLRHDQRDPVVSSRMTAQEIATIAVVAVGGALVLIGALALIRLAACWGVSEYRPTVGCTVATGLFWLSVVACVVGVFSAVYVFLAGRISIRRVETERAAIVRDRWSNPVSVRAVLQAGPAETRAYFELAAQAEMSMAPFKQYPAGLDSLSISNSAVKAADDKPALAAPQIGPVSYAEWLRWLDSEPHAIFAARTKGGKSTMAKVGLKARIERGESVFVIDPHSNGWLDLPGVGGGLNWVEVEAGIAAITQLYRERMQERERYQRETGRELPQDHFPRITVIFDEANEARTHIEARHPSKKSPWQPFVETMGSGARKVGISLWLICQSALIKNLGGSTVMRRNFTVFALDHSTIRELVEDEEPMVARRDAIIEGIAGQQYPAATVIAGQAFLLDRTGLDQMTPGSAAGCAWAGWDYTQRAAIMAAPLVYHRPPVAKAREDGAVRLSVPIAGAIIYPATITSTKGRIAWLLQQRYTYRQIEKELGVSHQTISQVNVALQAQKKTANRWVEA
jgi:hypothetical protein